MEITNKIRHWWIPVLLGVLLFASAIYISAQPIESFIGLTLLFGWIIAFNGISNIVFSIRNKNIFEGWIWHLSIGIFEIILGTILIFKPNLSAESLILFTGFWLMFSAISKVGFSLILKKINVPNWWLSLITGILLLVFSVLIIINPYFAIISIIYLICIPIALLGFLAILLGFQIKNLNLTF